MNNYLAPVTQANPQSNPRLNLRYLGSIDANGGSRGRVELSADSRGLVTAIVVDRGGNREEIHPSHLRFEGPLRSADRLEQFIQQDALQARVTETSSFSKPSKMVLEVTVSGRMLGGSTQIDSTVLYTMITAIVLLTGTLAWVLLSNRRSAEPVITIAVQTDRAAMPVAVSALALAPAAPAQARPNASQSVALDESRRVANQSELGSVEETDGEEVVEHRIKQSLESVENRTLVLEELGSVATAYGTMLSKIQKDSSLYMAFSQNNIVEIIQELRNWEPADTSLLVTIIRSNQELMSQRMAMIPLFLDSENEVAKELMGVLKHAMDVNERCFGIRGNVELERVKHEYKAQVLQARMNYSFRKLETNFKLFQEEQLTNRFSIESNVEVLRIQADLNKETSRDAMRQTLADKAAKMVDDINNMYKEIMNHFKMQKDKIENVTYRPARFEWENGYPKIVDGELHIKRAKGMGEIIVSGIFGVLDKEISPLNWVISRFVGI